MRYNRRALDIMFCILLVLFVQDGFSYSKHFSGTIIENTTFLYRKLPVAPSISANIEFSVAYNQRSMRDAEHYPLMGIYTTYPEINIAKGCSYIRYGQLRNENLHPHLKVGTYRTTTCELSGSDIVNCRGRVTVQDYIPRNFYLTFGFHCNWPRIHSLQGLTYNISFTEQNSDSGSCRYYLGIPHSEACKKFYSETSVPNLVGDEKLPEIMKHFKLKRAFEMVAFADGTCYQHFWEIACHVLLPKCDPVTKEVTHPCREMCWNFINGCWPKFKIFLTRMSSEWIYENKHFLKHISSINISEHVGCDYLPSLHGSIPCFYKQVTCPSLPDVTNGTMILNTTQKDVYQLHDVVQYTCINDKFEMIGNTSITCLYNGEWSHPPPRCSRGNHLHPLALVLPVLLIPLVVLLLGIIIIKVKANTINVLSRAREFDAFICYKFDTDNHYVIYDIMENFEKLCDPPLKLFIHGRDFIPGIPIVDNIKDAIAKSNSAIIVMSQAFIDSDWGPEEFAHCYLENMKDPAFKIYMIMMQPVECLDNLSEYMKSFMESRTYLSKYDPQLFQKIASYLHWVKMPKGEKSREPPRLENGAALLRELNAEDDMTESEIEIEFVPSDPFLCIHNEDDEDKNDQSTKLQEFTFNNEDFQTHQVNVEVHHTDQHLSSEETII